MSESSGNPAGAAENIRQVSTLFSGVNGTSADEFDEQLMKEPILNLEIDDEELQRLSASWSREYDEYFKEKIDQRQKTNYDYWKGKQVGSTGLENRGTDNIIFEGVETLLPIACRQSPDPSCEAEETEEGDFVADATSRILSKVANAAHLKSNIKRTARNWSLDFLGCMKMGWDEKINDMFFQVIDPRKIKLDPKGYFNGGEFVGRFIGEEKSATAEDLCNEFPKYKDEISTIVGDQMGTSLTYMEWWTDDMLFWQFKNFILDKRKNPYWNGDYEEETMDEMGVPGMEMRQGTNHFACPKKPYAFLSVFNTGKQPHDETNLVEQVIMLQDIINKRLRQIDKNADATNNSIVVNKSFGEDDAKNVSDAMKNGGTIIAPTEDVRAAVMRIPAPSLAPDVYNDMQDKRSQVYNIMGVRGSTAQGVISEQTVRGKLQLKGQDVDRLSLIVEQIEQMVDWLYNLATQTIYVFYTPENTIRYLGEEDGMRYISAIKNGPSRRIVVSVKEGSMVPQDSLTKRNEAIDLWAAGAIDPVSFFERLDFPDPKESARQLLTYTLNPQQYLVELGGMPPMQPGVPGAPMPGAGAIDPGMEQPMPLMQGGESPPAMPGQLPPLPPI